MIGKEFVLGLVAGVMLAAPYVTYASHRPRSSRIFGVGLVGAAMIYVVLAVAYGTLRNSLVETAGLGMFLGVAALGVRFSRYVLALGWVAHVAWDLVLHPVNASSYAPWWYPVMCIGFDLLVAGAIVGTSSRDQRTRRLENRS